MSAGPRTGRVAQSPATKTRPRRRPAAPRQVLPSLALIFFLAGLIRLGAGIGTALAEGPDPGVPQLAGLAHTAEPVHDNFSASAPFATGTAELLVQITRREQAVREREAALAERAQLLAAADERLTLQIAALEAAERELASTMALADRAAEDDIARMVAVFESMKPEEAALVFTEMDPGFAAGFLSRLRSDAAAAIMAGLEPRQAYLLSTIVAGRNALVPRN